MGIATGNNISLKRIQEIAAGEHDTSKIPALNFRGAPLGIDVRKVVETGFTPSSTPASPARGRGSAKSAPASRPFPWSAS